MFDLRGKPIVTGRVTCKRHNAFETQKMDEKTAKGSRHAQRQQVRRDDGAKQYQSRDPDQAEQNDNAKSKRTKNCISRVWLWGWYFGVRPCGFILNCRPLFISDSNHQILEALNESFPVDKPSYIWLDKACAFWYWLLDSKCPSRAEGWESVVFLVDRFHKIAGHLGEKTATAKFCKEYCHSTLLQYKGLRDLEGKSLGNSEAAEPNFSKFVRFGSNCMNMTLSNQRFFLFSISETINSIQCMNLKHRQVEVVRPPDHIFNCITCF